MTKEERAALVEELKNRYALMAEKHEFSPGQVVWWKEGLANKTSPKGGDPAVVVSTLPEPTFDPDGNGGSAYFREPLDLVIGIIGSDGKFRCFHVDSRRFEPYPES